MGVGRLHTEWPGKPQGQGRGKIDPSTMVAAHRPQAYIGAAFRRPLRGPNSVFTQ